MATKISLGRILLVLVLLFSQSNLSATSLAQNSETSTYTIRQLIDNAKRKNYSVRANAERVYRARQRIRVAMGRLLPSLNFGTIMAGVQMDYFDLVPSLLGFLFPSNWFRWKESKLYFQAERRNYATMIANEINAVESLAYRVHSIKVLEQIYVFYLGKVNGIVEVAKKRAAAGEDTADISLKFENIALKMAHDIDVLRNETQKQQSNLAHAIALDLSKDWDNFDIAPIRLPDLSNKRPMDSATILDEIFRKSLEIKAFAFLRKAAKYSKYNRSFQFLSPNGDADGSFGFGYFAYVNIGKSKEREIEVKQEELNSNLKTATRKAVADYNLALRLFKRSVSGFENAESWYGVLDAKFKEGGEYVPAEYVDAFESLLAFKSRVAQAQHYFLISKAQIERLRWNRSHYRGLLEFSPNEKAKDAEHVESWMARTVHSVKRKLEDRKIKKDLKRGKLKLDGT